MSGTVAPVDRSATQYVVERVAVASLVPYAKNSRTHKATQIKQLAEAIRRWGFTNPVLVDEHGTIIAGHGRVLAAQLVGLVDVPVVRVTGLSDEERRALVIADNQIALNSGWDKKMLAAELSDLRLAGFDVGMVGFDKAALQTMLQPTARAGLTDPDDTPSLAALAASRPGDVWLCGSHRVACGDSTQPAVWAAVMQGEMADVCWCDPPYNVAYQGGTKDKLSIVNDSLAPAAFGTLLAGMMGGVFGVMKAGAAIYVAHADTEGLAFRQAFVGAGFKLSGCIIWRKDSLVLGRSDYQWMHEPILYGWKPGAPHRWYGGRKQTTIADVCAPSPVRQLEDGRWVIEVGDAILVVDGKATLEVLPSSVVFHERPRRNAEHPTMKPVGLIEKQLTSSASPGDIVIDCCGGSGSTLIAAERLCMKSRLVELDPRFADVIVRRWQAHAGGKATRLADGALFDDVAAAARQQLEAA